MQGKTRVKPFSYKEKSQKPKSVNCLKTNLHNSSGSILTSSGFVLNEISKHSKVLFSG